METLKSMLEFFLMLIWAIGTIGGAGNLIYYGEYFPAICVAITGCMAFPKTKEIFYKYLM